MSAWVCTRRHIAAVVRFAIECNMRDSAVRACQLANTLMSENVRSVRYRYDDSEAATEAPFTLAEIHAAPVLAPVVALKACDCLRYQSCECNDYDDTEAARLLLTIRELAVGRGAVNSSPAYERASWGIPEVQP